MASCAHLYGQVPGDHAAAAVELKPPQEPLVGKRSWVFPTYLLGVQEFLEHMTTAYPGLLGPTHEWARGHGSVERFEGIHQALHFGLLLQPCCG